MKMEEGETRGVKDKVKAESSEEDSRAAGGLLSDPFNPRVKKTMKHTPSSSANFHLHPDSDLLILS